MVQSLVHDTDSLSGVFLSGVLVLSGFSICAGSNLDILGMKFDSMLTFEDHVRGIISRVSQRNGILWLVKHVFLNASVFLLATLHLFSQSLSNILRLGGLLLNAIFSFSSARCVRWPGFTLI